MDRVRSSGLLKKKKKKFEDLIDFIKRLMNGATASLASSERFCQGAEKERC